MNYYLRKQKGQLKKGYCHNRRWRSVVSILAAIVLLCALFAPVLPTAAMDTDIVGEDTGETETGVLSASAESSSTTPVSGFMLWLHTYWDESVNPVKVAGYDAGVDGWEWGTEDSENALSDVLQITGTDFYLIPVSYFVSAYGDYGYIFNENKPGDCPFRYKPDAADETLNHLMHADYVQVGDTWYVQIEDSGTYRNPGNPRSNIYFTGVKREELQAVSNFRFWPYNNGSLIGQSEISTALQVVDTSYYLIPVSELESRLSGDYTFDKTECPFQYTPNASDGKANKTDAVYVQVDGVWYLRVQDTGYGANYGAPPRCNIFYTYVKPLEVIKSTISHPNTVINLFDYWLTEQKAADVKVDYPDDGINHGHALKFRYDGNKVTNVWNQWTKSEKVYQSIVANTLKDDYPVLSDTISPGESLAYLFDPTKDVLVDDISYKESHRNVSGLLQIDPDGYYCYDSGKNFAEYKEDTNSFALYNQPGVLPGGAAKTDGQFFPFNSMEEVAEVTSIDPKINHYLGLTLSTRFIQQYDGHTNSSRNTETTFEFAGDDDVWIFIDGVLAADLGGIHDAARVKINFATGKVTINNDKFEQSTTLREAFEKAGALTTVQWDEDEKTFANNTIHTLRFFYLERGNTDSNLYLKYNLTEIPVTSIFKVDQYSKEVEGAGFAVYAADDSWQYLLDSQTDEEDKRYISLESVDYTVDEETGVISINDGEGEGSTITPRYTGVTNAAGEMIFMDEDGVPYSLKELQDEFGGDHFILREIRVPAGYRLVTHEIPLYIQNNLLLCGNTYASGVWSATTELVTATDTIYLSKGAGRSGLTEQRYYNDDHTVNGALFAVVLKYIGDAGGDQEDENNWAPVYGSDMKGYTVVDVSQYDTFKEAVIDTAKKAQEFGDVTFSISSSGSMQVELTNLPRNIQTYYHMLEQNGGDTSEAQYAIGYYWTNESDLNQATVENTFRVIDTKGLITTTEGKVEIYDGFDRAFGAAIRVPNLINRLFAQKLDEDGNLVNGAGFALYQVEETEGTIYYITEGNTLIELDPKMGDEAAGGKARIKGEDTLGEYTIDSGTGTIKVTIGGKTEVISPAKNADGEVMIGTTEDNKIAGEQGTCDFANLCDGAYYLREIAAPAGYEINDTEVMVLVTDDAVYANAGTADDGVSVARGPGYVVSTLAQFASEGDIDNTLSWVYERLLVSGVSASFQDVYTAFDEDGNPGREWGYLKARNDPNLTVNEQDALTVHLKYDTSKVANTLFNYTRNDDWYEKNGIDTSDVTRRLYTSVGWSYYLSYQDTEYGTEEAAKNGAGYTDLSRYGDISNLFSRSTYVQMTDKRIPGNLEISKKVTKEEGTDTPPPDQEFTFSVNLFKTLTDGGGNPVKIPLTEEYGYVVYEKDETGRRSIVTDESGNPVRGTIKNGSTISLKNGQTAVIEDIPAGTDYTVTEAVYDRYEVTAVRDEGKPQTASADTGHKEVSGRTVSGRLYWRVDENGILDNTSTVAYTNIYEPYRTALKITKQDAADGTLLNGVVFELEKLDDEGNAAASFGTDGKKTETTGEIVEDSGAAISGTAMFTALEDGFYRLTEVKAADGYYLLKDSIIIEINQEEKKYTVDGVEGDLTGENDIIELTVKNQKALVMPNTGGNGHSAPMYLIVGGLVLIMAAFLTCVYVTYGKEGKKKMGT